MARLLGFAIYCATCVLLVGLLMSVIPGMEAAYTTRYQAHQAAQTARHLASQQTAQAWAAQFGDTARTLAMWGAVAAVAIVVAVQAGRTSRHAATQRTEERRILLLYAAQYLPGVNVQIRTVEGVPTLLDYSTRQAVPLPVAERALMARGLLVDGRQ